MSTLRPYVPPAPLGSGRGRRSSPGEWRWRDRVALVLAWAAGLGLCLIAAAIVGYMAFRGVQYLRPSLIFSRPKITEGQPVAGGFLDPLLGTLILTLIGILLAGPLAIACALWIVEYGRPRWLARVVESSIEIIAGTPDVVIALFGLTMFQLSLFAPFSGTSEHAGVFGRSFFAAGAMMSLIAIAPIFAATRDGLQAVPSHMREAAFALGKTRAATIRRVLLPSIRSNIATGVTLGVSRLIGDTVIVLLLLGDTLRIDPEGSTPVVGLLRGTGSTLTNYVYDNSPAGESGAPQKAYAAATLLMIFVLVLNLIVDRIGRSQADSTGLTIAGAVV